MNRLIITMSALILCLVVGCQDKEAMAELEAFKAQADVEDQNEALYRQFVDELNKGNTDSFDEYLAPGYAYYSPSNTQDPLSLEEVRELVETHFKSFPDYRWKIEELYAVKDRIIVRISTSSTFTEAYLGIPPTGKKIESSGISIVRMENGKVVEERKEVNSLDVLQQLGMELRPKEGE